MLGDLLWKGLKKSRKSYPKRILEIRGRGLMIGIEMDEATSVHERLLSAKILTNCIRGKVIRLLPPYILTEAEVERFLREFDAILEESS
jgi:acetylornithine/succinyldiaminopimelate/putrescine aminotransferase